MSPKEMSASIRKNKKLRVENEPLPTEATLDTASDLETNEALTSDGMEPSDKEKARMARLKSQLGGMRMSK